MSATETTDFITPKSIEYAYGRMLQERDRRNQSIADAGMRAARARDPRLLKVLEKGAEFTGKASEEQMGQTRRGVNIDFRWTVEHTEAQLWREAYVAMDQGRPLEHFQWIYGAAAIACGYI